MSRNDPRADRHVALVISSLTVGGAERVLSAMANYWAEKNWNVSLITLSDDSSDHYSLHPDVRRIALAVMAPSANRWAAVSNNLRRLVAIRQAIRETKAPVVIAFGEHTNVLTLLATVRTSTCVIVSERNDPRHHRIGASWDRLRRMTYGLADALVVQTKGLVPWALTHIGGTRIRVIENAVTVPYDHRTTPRAETGHHVVLAMGRLMRQKGFDVLLRAFASVAPSFPEWSATIVGDGEECPRLTALAEDLGISDRLSMPGFTAVPRRAMMASDIFVLSSLHEGFPNVLLEAMAYGMPVISSDCPSGPSDIIHDGVDGILVPPGDVEQLARALGQLMGDERLRLTLGKNAVAVRDRFQPEAVMAKWEALIDDCQAEPRRPQRSA